MGEKNASETWTFDQSNNAPGWRAIDTEALQILAIERFLSQNTDASYYRLLPKYLLHWHVGQAFAHLLDYQNAISWMSKSYSSDSEWNEYVAGTISFLNQETVLFSASALNLPLLAHMRRLSASRCWDYRLLNDCMT